MRHAILSLAAAICLVPCAIAQGDSDLWVMVVAPACVAQDASYRDTPLGKPLLARAPWEQFRRNPLYQCYREKNWTISKALCDDLMSASIDTTDFEPIAQRHIDELHRLQRMFAYANDAMSDGPSTPCPAN